jgi:hypothetical protein
MSPLGPRHPISETSWRRGAAVAFFVLVVAFGVLLERAEDKTAKVDKRVAKVESPCLKYGPDSDECEEAFSAAVSTITHPQACAIERKAGTLRAIRELADAVNVTFTEPCAGARLAQERQRGNEREATAKENGSDGGGATDSPSSDDAPSVPDQSSGDGDAPVSQDPGSDPAPAPPKGDNAAPTPSPTASSPPSSPSSGGSTVTNPPPAASPPPAPEPAPDPPGLIQSTVDRVDDAITPTVCAVSELLRGTCP